MADRITLPGVGGVPRRAVEAVAGAAAAFIVWRWWRSRSASAAAGAVPVPVDTSNTVADQSAVGYSNPGGIPLATGDSSGVILTDALWTQAAESGLSGLYDPTAVLNALGAYLASQPLTGDQQIIVRAAWAMEGKPPENPNLPIIPAQSPPSGGTTPPPASGGGSAPAHPQTIYVSDGTLSLNGLASAYGVSAASILAATTPMEPSDVATYLKLTGPTWTHVLPAHTKWVIPAH